MKIESTYRNNGNINQRSETRLEKSKEFNPEIQISKKKKKPLEGGDKTPNQELRFEGFKNRDQISRI